MIGGADHQELLPKNISGLEALENGQTETADRPSTTLQINLKPAAEPRALRYIRPISQVPKACFSVGQRPNVHQGMSTMRCPKLVVLQKPAPCWILLKAAFLRRGT